MILGTKRPAILAAVSLVLPAVAMAAVASPASAADREKDDKDKVTYDLAVEKTAETFIKRSHDWEIDKRGDTRWLELDEDETGSVDYEVTVDAEEDERFFVFGHIKIKNPDPKNDALITDVEDEVNGTDAKVWCGVKFSDKHPYELEPGETLKCKYLAEVDDDADTTNTATVSVDEDSEVGGGEGTADVDFDDARVKSVDDCVKVWDSEKGFLGKVCADDAPKTFKYSLDVGPYDEAGRYWFENVAAFKTNDTDTKGHDKWVVKVKVHEVEEEYDLEVEKDAKTFIKRSWDWDIEKSADVRSLRLETGESEDVDYEVTLDAEAEEKFLVFGHIKITNPDPKNDALITDVEDEVNGTDAKVWCGEKISEKHPYELGPEETLKCKYLAVVEDDDDATNTATVTVDDDSEVGGGEGTADVDFDNAHVKEVDECVKVWDSAAGFLGKVCADDAPKTISYDAEIGPFDDAGRYWVKNVAVFKTLDTGTRGHDKAVVKVKVVEDKEKDKEKDRGKDRGKKHNGYPGKRAA